MTDNVISINLWDDYHDDGFIPEGKIQETYAYVESDMEDQDCKTVLELLKTTIEGLAKTEWKLELYLNYHDSTKIYPNLVGTEYEFTLYKRWQLEVNNPSLKAGAWN